MRSRFDEQLAQLNNMLIEMGALIERAIMQAVQALIEQDNELAQQVIDSDQDVDQKEKDIEAFCLKLLLQQQPVASDLRLISACLKMITDMERIADQAADISEITQMLIKNGNLAISPLITMEHFPQMATATVKMVTDSIDAYVKMDLRLAKAVVQSDDEVDALFDTVKYELIDWILADSSNGEQAIDLIMIAKYFERIGDHAVNVAEWVAFSITGKHVRFFPEQGAELQPWE
ncbi:MAG: phosphate signaling complex protein PhoU, partial [Coriobacteriales bacterium]|nr:phosphate signaling complex protein PhoU [Coriobacteriales bacterium]